VRLAVGLAVAGGSAAALNWGWVAQHAAASGLPRLTMRRPLRSLRTLFAEPAWLAGFVAGIAGWALYVLALRLAPLSLVQAVSAGGVGLLALLAQRASGTRLSRREWTGVAVAVAGLALLAVSLWGGSGGGSHGSWAAVAAWMGVSLVVAALLALPGAPRFAAGAGFGLAAGVLYAAGDVGTKAAVAGGAALWFVPLLLACHGLGFVSLQLGFQRGRAIATAGTATLLTNALPIAAGLALFHEGLPHGPLGALRVLAFACVVLGAATLTRPS
jgi:hypothetical protein